MLFVAPLVTLPAVALLVAPPLADDREEAEARHALDRLRSEGGYASMPTAADQCEWSAAAGIGREDLGNLFGRKLLRFSVQRHGHVERIEGSYTCNIASAQTCV